MKHPRCRRHVPEADQRPVLAEPPSESGPLPYLIGGTRFATAGAWFVGVRKRRSPRRRVVTERARVARDRAARSAVHRARGRLVSHHAAVKRDDTPS
jgi:hypothetical protein